MERDNTAEKTVNILRVFFIEEINVNFISIHDETRYFKDLNSYFNKVLKATEKP